MNHKPQVLDASGAELPEEILELSERLARDAHENWSRQRLAAGWQYGPQADDARHEDPRLAPYEELPESEKQFFRDASLETLKAILSLGYRIEAPDHSAAAADEPPVQKRTVDSTRVSLENLDEMDLTALCALWQSRNPEQWARSPEAYISLGNRILKSGEPLVAHDVLKEGLNLWPDNVRLRQMQALALARSGAIQRANNILTRLYDEGHRDEETLGLLARTYKDLWTRSKKPAEGEAHLRRAFEVYNEAYRSSGGYWTGVNAATTALLLGHRERASALAREVRSSCLSELETIEGGGGDPYWLLATLGEATLILKDWSEAEQWYTRAIEVGRGRFGELISTRRNARLITDALGIEREWVERFFKIPSVVVFAGHMIDRPGRLIPRFPPEMEGLVREAIRARLIELNAGLGYASAACGSDIIFLEEILRMGGEAHIVLPYNQKQFIEDSVEIVPGGEWKERFDSVIQRATDVLTASEQSMEGGVSFEYTNLLLHGLANIRAGQLETKMIPLAVWDGKSGDGAGGTASTVEHWRAVGQTVEIIDLNRMLAEEFPQLVVRSEQETPAGPAPAAQGAEFTAEMIAILFADAVNFSRLTEDEIPRFVRYFLGTIGELAAASKHSPVMKNTWGDGLYFVFKSVGDAGQFALELCEHLGKIDWAEKGLPKDLSLRIALHAGPVYSCIDPVTQQPNYIGTHVSRAARIEPITPPGQVYASQAFAALASAQHERNFTCDYVGQTPLAKGYGTFPTYHVRSNNLTIS
ncbi:MAG TPA: TRAFs-binding domain-containing protein [Pyrinomonadaceae bacterium]